MNIGDVVRVKPPFSHAFGGEYRIDRVETLDDESVVFMLDGIEVGFCADYLEVV